MINRIGKTKKGKNKEEKSAKLLIFFRLLSLLSTLLRYLYVWISLSLQDLFQMKQSEKIKIPLELFTSYGHATCDPGSQPNIGYFDRDTCQNSWEPANSGIWDLFKS